MDDFMTKVERLAELAAKRRDPLPLDAASIMTGIRGLEMEDDALSIPLGFLSGGAAAAAAAAVVITLFAATAWSDLSSPFVEMASLLDIADIML